MQKAEFHICLTASMSVVTNMIPYELITQFDYWRSFHPFSLRDVWHQKHTHKLRLLSVSPLTTCGSPFLQHGVFVFAPIRLCVRSYAAFHFHPIPPYKLPPPPPPPHSSLPCSTSNRKMSKNTPQRESILSVLQRCWSKGGGAGGGIYCKLSLRSWTFLNFSIGKRID